MGPWGGWARFTCKKRLDTPCLYLYIGFIQFTTDSHASCNFYKKQVCWADGLDTLAKMDRTHLIYV